MKEKVNYNHYNSFVVVRNFADRMVVEELDAGICYYKHSNLYLI